MDHQFDESYPFVFIGHVCTSAQAAHGQVTLGSHLENTVVSLFRYSVMITQNVNLSNA